LVEAMIRVYLVRHGIAADPVPEVPDESGRSRRKA